MAAVDAGTQAGRSETSVESEVLKLHFSNLVGSIDVDSVLSAALSKHLITDRQRTECASEPDSYKKAEKFFGHLVREVNGDSSKFHSFIEVLDETGHYKKEACRLRDEFARATCGNTRQPLSPSSDTEGEQIVVPDQLLEELASLRCAYARFLRRYEKELKNSPEAQEEFVETLPRLLKQAGGAHDSFHSYFNELIEEEVSIFNISYLKNFCDSFPDDVCVTTKKLVEEYERQRQHFMASTTVNQFKQLFPLSATPCQLLTGKTPVKLKLLNTWGTSTLDDLLKLVGLFGVPGKHLHLSKINEGCIAVVWLCSSLYAEKLNIAVNEAAGMLHDKGVLQVSIGEEVVFESSQSDQELLISKPATFQFLDEPENDFFCPVCHELLLEPFLTECGHYTCRSCRNQLLTSHKEECPMCREPDILSNARLDKHHQRKVKSCKVYCHHHEKGCKWVGEIGYLQEHLKGGQCVTACPFRCGEYLWQRDMKEHLRSSCRRRPTTCEYCGYHEAYNVVTEKHYPVCLQFPILCPNNCTCMVKRSQLQQHLHDCPLQLVKCPCSYTGCFVQLPRIEMAAHTLQQHNQVLGQVIKQAIPCISSPSTQVNPQYLYNLQPVVFTITDFLERKQADEEWRSPPYYTHSEGYKLQVNVFANGNETGKGTHMSIYVWLMRGEYDNGLEWPFEGAFVFELINWREDKEHFLKTFHLNRLTDLDYKKTSRVVDGEIATTGYGDHQFICQANLNYNPDKNTEYLCNDCVQLRVCVAIYSTKLRFKAPSWQNSLTKTQSVCEFTLTNFSERKQFNSTYLSLPFYTHSQGYKLCLVVDANGSGSGKNTHVSIGAIIMRGEHDQHLQWPFIGDIEFELLNWKEDRKHHKETLTIDINSGCIQVTDRMYGSFNGIPQFVSHSSLLYNSATNTEYMQNNCLRLRASVTFTYSTALVNKTPSWQGSLATTQPLCEFTLTEFSRRKHLNSKYTSLPFYAYPHQIDGSTEVPEPYKLCLDIFANGINRGEGTHISINARLVKGEHDERLHWPFEGDIIVQLINWREDKGHYEETICFDRHADQPDPEYSHCCLMADKELVYSAGWGHDRFFPHSSLSYTPSTNTEYLEEDCLHLRVKEVIFYSSTLLYPTLSWQDTLNTQSVCEFTLTEFSKRKQFNNYSFSPPFYTHDRGYKMTLVVCANGYRSAKGTHISVSTWIMEGEYDNELHWPFEGDVIIELLNWREDSEHQTRLLEFSRRTDPDGLFTSRVKLHAGLAAMPWFGRYDMFSHSSLPYDSSTNTEYLQDDCLRLRVRKVRIYKLHDVKLLQPILTSF